MTLSHKLKFIFIHVHRTGGSTLISLLKSELGHDVEVLSQHGNAATLEKLQLENHPEYFTFGFVRNPWERLLSWYLLINKESPRPLETDRAEFELFLDEERAAEPSDKYFHYNQLDYFPKNHEAIENFKIFRYENYEQEVENIFNLLQIPKFSIEKHNGTKAIDYRDYYSEKSKLWVEQNCQRDIEFFNYSF